MAEVAAFLNGAGLGEYVDAFVSDGWDDLRTLSAIEEDDLKSIVPKGGHRVKFKNALKDHLAVQCASPQALAPPVIHQPRRSILDYALEAGDAKNSIPPGLVLGGPSVIAFSDSLLSSLNWELRNPDSEAMRYQEAELLGNESDAARRLLAWVHGQFNLDKAEYVPEHVKVVRNETLLSSFRLKIASLEEQRVQGGKVFNSCLEQDTAPGDDMKTKFLKHALVHHMDLPQFRRVGVTTAFHGCAPAVADSVAARGAKDLRQTDGGYHGAGPYVTHQAGYAARYASGELSSGYIEPNSLGQWSVVLFVCVTGNTYPVTRKTDYENPDDYHDTSVGRFHCDYPIGQGERCDKVLKSGYDCHYIPTGTQRPVNFQCSPTLDTADVEERVYKEESQLYPLCKIFFRTKLDAIQKKLHVEPQPTPAPPPQPATPQPSPAAKPAPAPPRPPAQTPQPSGTPVGQGFKTTMQVIKLGSGEACVKRDCQDSYEITYVVKATGKVVWNKERRLVTTTGEPGTSGGWKEGLVGMTCGEVRQFDVPAAEAFGEKAPELIKGIPPNADLIVTAKLMEIRGRGL